MAGHEMRKIDLTEGIHRKRKLQKPSGGKVKARDRAANSGHSNTVFSDSYSHILSDARLAHHANVTRKAKLLSDLQQSHGNTYVQRLLKSQAIQAKLTVNPPDDKYEQEADRVGDAVARAPGSQIHRQEEEEPVQAKVQRQEEEEELQAKLQRQEEEEEEPVQAKAIQRQEEEEEPVQAKVQRQEEEEELQAKLQRQEEEEELQTKLQRQEEEEEPVQTKSLSDEAPMVSSDLEKRIDASRGSGEALPDSIRASFEPRMGHDFSDVRVHTDSEADSLSRQLGAKAFTTGQDVYFRSGAYQPDSEGGKQLLGHEMTHVVQQGGAPVARKITKEEGQVPSGASKEAAQEELKKAEDEVTSSLSQATIKALLYWAAISQEVGAEESAQYALEAAANKSLELLEAKTAALDIQTGTQGMVEDVLNQLAMVQLLGGEKQEEAAEETLAKVLEWAETQLLLAVELLQQTPAQESANVVAEKAALVQMLGGDASPGIEALNKWAIEFGRAEEENGEIGMVAA